MAQVNYNEGVAESTPSNEGTPYQSGAGASPEAFGSGIGQGLEKLGTGATVASKYFGKVAADSASNDFQDYATKLMHGDSSKQVAGPDGQMMADTGYLGTRGRAALDQRPVVEQALDDKIKEIRSTLQTPEQQQDFDNFSRRYRVGTIEKVGSHADTQASTWYTGVNTASAKLAMDHIANNFDKPADVAAGFSDLAHAYTKNAQLQGATPDSPQWKEAEAAAKRDALQAQLNAMAVKDPARALAVLDKNKDIAGVQYDNLAAQYRGRAKQAQGFDVANQTIKATYSSNPAVNPVVLTNAGAQYGVTGSYLMRVQQMETGSNPNQTSPTGAQGPFQFIPSTAKRYGLADPFNYAASADAAARFAADNKVTLTSSLGRVPSDQELYLAHNQGAQGASLLLAHPNQRAGDLVGDRAIRVNGGDPDAPAATFTSMITGKFNNAPVAATANRKAQAYQAIMSIPDDQIDPDVRQHALTSVNQQFSAQAIAEEQDAKAKKVASDQLQSTIASDIIKGTGPEVISRIANSGLPANEMENLYKFATSEGGVEDPLRYGPKYTDALKRVLADPDDPTRIGGPGEIIRMGATGDLSKRGVTELLGTMDKIKKQPDQAGISTVKSHQLDYYKNQFGIDQSFLGPGVPAFKNPKGLAIFNHSFVPAFEAAYSKWIADGKDPMTFLSDNKQMDAIMDRVYPKSQRDADSISAVNEGLPTAEQKIPAAPAGVDAKAWGGVMKDPPRKIDGQPFTLEKWASAVNVLRSNPSPEVQAAFDKHFAPSGYTAKDILSRLPVKPTVVPAPEKRAEAAPAPAQSHQTTIESGSPLAKLVKESAVEPYTPAGGHPDSNIQTVGIRG